MDIIETILGVVVGSTAASAIMSFWTGWCLMIATGVAYHTWGWPGRTIGYWAAVLLVFVITVLTGAFKTHPIIKAPPPPVKK
jgi:hypothetical protein